MFMLVIVRELDKITYLFANQNFVIEGNTASDQDGLQLGNSLRLKIWTDEV